MTFAFIAVTLISPRNKTTLSGRIIDADTKKPVAALLYTENDKGQLVLPCEVGERQARDIRRQARQQCRSTHVFDRDRLLR